MKNYNPWDDKQCQADYCEENSTDFDYWIADNHPSDYRTSSMEKYELSYCEACEHDFLEFAANYEESLELDQADDDNEALKEKDWE